MATNVKGTIDPLAQKYIDEMNSNSEKYGEAATDEEKNKLHLKSVGDAAGLTNNFGYQTSYDPEAGWTVWGNGLKDAGDVAAAYKDASTSGGYGANTLRSATDQSDYISNYYSDAEKAALNALDASYQQNLLSLDASAAKIPQQYYTAKNEAAAQNAQQNQAFNEYSAASGLELRRGRTGLPGLFQSAPVEPVRHLAGAGKRARRRGDGKGADQDRVSVRRGAGDSRQRPRGGECALSGDGESGRVYGVLRLQSGAAESESKSDRTPATASGISSSSTVRSRTRITNCLRMRRLWRLTVTFQAMPRSAIRLNRLPT